MFKQNQMASPALVSHYMKQAFRLFHDIPYHSSIDAPDGWSELKLWSHGHKLGQDSLPVFSGASDFSIYAKPTDNLMFRAWHDSLHIKHNQPFTLQGELNIASIHVAELTAVAAPYNVVMTIYADVAAQIKYFYHTGEFVKDQKAFIEYVVNGGDYREWTQ